MKAMYKEELIEKIIKSSNLVSRKEKEELLEYWNNKKLYIEKGVFYLGSDKKTYSNMIFELNDEIANLQQESKQLKNNWNILKEFIKKSLEAIDTIQKLIGNAIENYTPRILTYEQIKDKMQEIEQGSDSNE